MTKTAALNDFFSDFGLPAYTQDNVPDDAKMPYLTYEVATSDFGEGEVSIVVNLWYRTESEAIPNKKAEEIGKFISRGGCIVVCDGGGIWIKKGSPFCLNITDPDDTTIKRRYLNIDLEFLTT